MLRRPLLLLEVLAQCQRRLQRLQQRRVTVEGTARRAAPVQRYAPHILPFACLLVWEYGLLANTPV